MNTQEAVAIFNDPPDDPTHDEQYPAALQALIDSGSAWRLEGAVGRECMAAIEAGACILGPYPFRDYYGNVVPSWSMVEAGSKGSPEYAGIDRPDVPEDHDDRLHAIGLVRREH